jgi:DNA-binding NarL/FixJ family response regulator
MTIMVTGPNGATVEFPDGTDHATINGVMAKHFGGPDAEPKTGVMEAIGRAALDTGSFGFANGLQDRERMHLARKEHPWASLAGDVVGVGAQTVALGPVGAAAGRAAQVGGVVGRVGRAGEAFVGALTPDLAANSARAVAATSAKVGASQGALHGFGTSVTDSTQDWKSVAANTAFEGAIGTVAGGVAGPLIHGTVRGAAALKNRLLPGSAEAAELARQPGQAGVNDVLRAMDYDRLSPEVLARQLNVAAPAGSGLSAEHARTIAQRLGEGQAPADLARMFGVTAEHVGDIGRQQAALEAKYGNLNLLEAARTGDLRNIPNAPTAQPIHPGNQTSDTAEVVADLLGQGLSQAQIANRLRIPAADVAHVAGQAETLAAREAALSPQRVLAQDALSMRPEVQTTSNLGRLTQWAANQEGRGADQAAESFARRKDSLGTQVTDDVMRATGSADRVGDGVAIQDMRAQSSANYDRLTRNAPNVNVPNFGGMETVPEFQAALRAAGVKDQIRNPGQGMHVWAPFDGTTATEGRQYLSPRQIIDVHHELVMAAKPNPLDPSKARINGDLKRWFSGQADEMLQGHGDLRQYHAQVMRVMEATEKGAEMPITTGGRTHPSMVFFEGAQREVRIAERMVRREELRFNASQQRAADGQIRRPMSEADLRSARADLDARSAVVEEFRKSWGEQIAQSVFEKGGEAPANTTIKNLLSPEGKARILTILGRQEGQNLIASMYNKQMQSKLGDKLYGGPDTAWKTAMNSRMGAGMQAGTAMASGRFMDAAKHLGDVAFNGMQTQRADRINGLMSQQGLDALRTTVDGLVSRRAAQTQFDPMSRNPALQTAVPALARGGREQLRD